MNKVRKLVPRDANKKYLLSLNKIIYLINNIK